ncbi:hypothetical protein EHQ53_03240 [Leptospira langatensis]|uniref:Uncharacterized protein n=1 Tax=Leptospira langatensis TaxID=2484983 RepID=A0A5F1ZXZ0_9LEPT|nr:hypothetical protein [Leptospira langatensis]TGK04176.1 hypothetical protein EHO57_03470 [Leptospira langatensis]TGL43656.1 hypothetical protein EHQ53_03240 [Leptospira langatensis]
MDLFNFKTVRTRIEEGGSSSRSILYFVYLKNLSFLVFGFYGLSLLGAENPEQVAIQQRFSLLSKVAVRSTNTDPSSLNIRFLWNTRSPILRLVLEGRSLISFAKLSVLGSSYDTPEEKNCFSQQTFIKTKHGYTSVENLKVGDFVLAGSDGSGALAYKAVTETFIQDVQSIHCKIRTQAVRKCSDL